MDVPISFDEINVHAANEETVTYLRDYIWSHYDHLLIFINCLSGCPRQNLQSSSRVRRCITSNGDDISIGALAVALIFT